MVKKDLPFTDLYAFDLNNILVGIQLYVVPQTDNGHHCTKFLCNLSSDHDHTVQQVATLVHICQRNDTITEFQLYGIHLQKTIHILRLPDLISCRFLHVNFLLYLGNLQTACYHSATDDKQHPHSHKQDGIQFCSHP